MTTRWSVGFVQDITEDDSDKTFTVPVNQEWEILWIYVQYTTTATGDSRQLEIQIIDSGNIIAQWQTGTTQLANLTYNYLFGVGIPDLISVRNINYLMTPLLGTAYLTAEQSIRIWDKNARDTTGDDMLVKIEYGYHNIE